uniref:Uncharacterized protein n=1 Tax=Ditylenchus dipsaci TaxID=166011 RepID=A0A915D7I0_9BILA
MIFSKVPALIIRIQSFLIACALLMADWKEIKVYPSYINNYETHLETLETGQLKPKFVDFFEESGEQARMPRKMVSETC